MAAMLRTRLINRLSYQSLIDAVAGEFHISWIFRRKTAAPIHT